MTNLSAVLAQLKAERVKLDKAIAALSGVAGGESRNGKRTLSLAGRKKIAAAQRARWATIRAKTSWRAS
jgi:hypothetical protein